MVRINDDGGESVEIEMDEEELHRLESMIHEDVAGLIGTLDLFMDNWDEVPASTRLKLGIWCNSGLAQIEKLLESELRPPEERN